jgi:hypothetical protein
LRTHKNAIKKILKIKQKNYLPTYLPTPFSGHLPDIRRFHFFLRRPLKDTSGRQNKTEQGAAEKKEEKTMHVRTLFGLEFV